MTSRVTLALGPPVTREGAQEEARRELSKSIYDGNEPDWPTRAVEWIGDQISDFWDWLNPDVSGGFGGFGGLGVLAVVLVVVALVVVARLWLGPVRRSARATADDDLELHTALPADQLRRQAEAFAASGDYAEAVRARLRAVVRMLEDKGVLDPRPGRTAQEIAAEVGELAPETSDALGAAASVFDEIWYGGRTASADSYATVVRADLALAKLRRRAYRSDDDDSELAVPV